MNYWIFQTGKAKYDIAARARPRTEETWYVRQGREDMRAGDIVYFWQIEAGAPLIATGSLVGPPFQDGADVRVQVRYNHVFKTSPSLDRIVADSRLTALPVLQTREGTNFQISTEQAAALSELLGPLAPVIHKPAVNNPVVDTARDQPPQTLQAALIKMLWYPAWRRAVLVVIILVVAAFAAWNSLPDGTKDRVGQPTTPGGILPVACLLNPATLTQGQQRRIANDLAITYSGASSLGAGIIGFVIEGAAVQRGSNTIRLGEQFWLLYNNERFELTVIKFDSSTAQFQIRREGQVCPQPAR